ncbi:MAG: T9SS type A sorting domain-containing protein, partial [Bacteroidales bacterium]|nr:T9SS type A sorting domain-containing protein [Bacteroidales bacterium]
YATGQEVTHTFEPNGAVDFYTVCLTTISYSPNSGDTCVAVSCQDVYIGGQSSGYLYGQIFAGNTLADEGLVSLIGYTSNSTFYMDFALIEGQGEYHFDDIPSGEYYIIAGLTPQSAYFWDYFPTWYEQALFWFDATPITLGDPNNPYNINLIPTGFYNPGIGDVEGNIKYGDAKGDPAEDIVILLMDENENPLHYVYSDKDGLFNFSDIAFGTYKVKAEVFGKTSESAIIILDSDNPTVNIGFVINGDNVTLSIDDNLQGFVSHLSEIYPNPINENANIKVSILKSTQVNISIYNQFGQLVYTIDETLGAGSQIIPVNTVDLSNGFYSLQILTSDGSKFIRKFVKAR